MKKIIFTLFVATSFLTIAQEKEEKGTFTLSGSVDTYFSSNLSSSDIGSVGVLSDVDANGFGLGMANTVFTYEKGKGGVVADLAFGPRANAANAYTGAINQLYAYYQATDKLKFTYALIIHSIFGQCSALFLKMSYIPQISKHLASK